MKRCHHYRCEAEREPGRQCPNMTAVLDRFGRSRCARHRERAQRDVKPENVRRSA